MDWSPHFPHYVVEQEQSKESAEGETTRENGSAMEGVTESDDATHKTAQPKRLIKDVEVADIGCGFGGLLVALGPAMPDTLILGLCMSSYRLQRLTWR